jgi:RND family efflux transporter MFP subunit
MTNPRGMVTMLLVNAAALLASGCDRKTERSATLPPPAVTVSRPVMREVTEASESTGTTAAFESVDVRARVSGFLEQVHYQAPARVNRGDVLFTIDARPFQNRLDAEQAGLEARKAQLPKVEFDADKLQRLFQTGTASQDELTTALAKRDSLRAEIAGAQAKLEQARLELDWCQVTAPISGRISRNLVDPGSIIAADSTLLAQIVNDDIIYVYFNASEQDVLMLREQSRQGQFSGDEAPATQPNIRELHWPIHVGLMTEHGYPHEGVLDYAAPAVDPSTGTIQVRGRFGNADGALMPGLFVRVWVPTSKPYAALMVTERAFGFDQGQRYLLVVGDQGVVNRRDVEVGPLQNGMRVVRAGIDADDRVIVNGIQRVRPGVTVKPVEVPMPTGPTAPNAASQPAASHAAASAERAVHARGEG